MNLYTRCQFGNHSVRVPAKAGVRQELPPLLTIRCSDVQCPGNNVPFTVQPWQVVAVAGSAQPLGGGALLATAGALVAGPAGIVIGGVLGTAGGRKFKQQDVALAQRFNQS